MSDDFLNCDYLLELPLFLENNALITKYDAKNIVNISYSTQMRREIRIHPKSGRGKQYGIVFFSYQQA
jgi:hypothetical protein